MIADKYELKSYLEKHPWPLRFSQERQVEYLYRFRSELSQEKLWPYLSDTSWLCGKLGLTAVKFTEKDGKLYYLKLPVEGGNKGRSARPLPVRSPGAMPLPATFPAHTPPKEHYRPYGERAPPAYRAFVSPLRPGVYYCRTSTERLRTLRRGDPPTVR